MYSALASATCSTHSQFITITICLIKTEKLTANFNNDPLWNECSFNPEKFNYGVFMTSVQFLIF